VRDILTPMTVTSNKITSNATWYLIALTFQKVISFVYFTLLARYLGPENTGKYFFATSFVLLFAVFAELGMSAIATREIAKQDSNGEKLFNQLLSFKIVTSIIVLGALAIIAPLSIPDQLSLILIGIAAVAMVLDGFTLLFYSGIRGRQNLGYESIATLIHQGLILIVGTWLMSRGFPVQIIILALIVGSVFNFLYSYWVARYKANFQLHWQWNRGLLLHLWTLIIPFALTAIFTRLYAYIDAILLKFIRGDTELGYYSIAYKITFAFQFIPLALIAALYPAFTYYWQHNKDTLATTFMRALQYLLLISLPISFGLIAAAPYLLPHIYTKSFNPSILPLQILISNLPFLFLNFPLGSLLNAINKQKTQTIIVASGLVWNVIANLLLIPEWGARGAALASTTSTILVFIISFSVISRYVAYPRAKTLLMAFKSLLAASLMALLVYLLAQRLNIYLTIVIAIIEYICSLWLLGLLHPRDIRSLLASLKRKTT